MVSDTDGKRRAERFAGVAGEVPVPDCGYITCTDLPGVPTGELDKIAASVRLEFGELQRRGERIEQPLTARFFFVCSI